MDNGKNSLVTDIYPSPVPGMANYPVMKDSGVDWLGEIPAHWNVEKLKHIASIRFSNVDKHSLEGETPVQLCNYVDVYYNDYITSNLDFMPATATESEITRFSLKTGDVIITKDSESWDDIAVSSYVPETLEGVLCGYHLAMIRARTERVYGEYLFRAFSADKINNQFKVAATGITRYGLGKYWIENAFFPLPPLAEQTAIAAFLDRKTAQIDEYVTLKEKAIALLQEQKTALINRAVTQGLNPAAPLKDSGIEWLGEIPAHWEVKKARWLFREIDQRSKTGNEQLLSVSHYDGVQKREDKNVYMFMAQSYEGYKLCKPDDLVINIMWAWMGALGVSSYSGIISNGYCVYRLRKKGIVDSKYLDMLVRTPVYIAHYIIRSKGLHSSRWRLYTDSFFEINFVLPPLDEQQQIVAHIEQAAAKIDQAIAQAQRQIELIKEYREALISQAVTGKIRVIDNG